MQKQQLTAEILADVRQGTIKLVNQYLFDNPSETKSGLANKIGIHPLQLISYLKSERGLTDKSLQKIGKFLISNQ